MRWLFVIAVVSGAASAQVAIDDDFEGGLVEPAGLWDTLSAAPMRSGILTPLAARNGTNGLRFNDTHVSTGNMAGVVLLENFAGSGDQTVRFWWRSTPSNTDDDMTLVNINIDSLINSATEIKWNPDAGRLFLVCHDESSNSVQAGPGALYVPDGGFLLLEAFALGVGSVNGSCAMAIDGKLIDDVSADFSGRQFAFLTLSAGQQDNEWTGAMDFDGVLAGRGPFPDRVVLADAGTLEEKCERLRFEFVAVDGTTRALSVTESIVVGLDGGAAFHDDQCLTPMTGAVAVDAGQAALVLFVKPIVPALVVETRARTMIGSFNVVPVVAVLPGDAGSDGGSDSGDGGAVQARRVATVGCACSEVDALVFVAGVLLLMRRRR